MTIKHVLLDNRALGKISKEQLAGSYPVWQTSLVNPDVAQYADLCGATGISVRRTDELDDGMRRLFEIDGPAFVAPALRRRAGLTVPPGTPATARPPRARPVCALIDLPTGIGDLEAGRVRGPPSRLTPRSPLALGAFLMVLNTAVDVAKAVLSSRSWNHSRKTALANLAAMIVEVVLLAVGILGLLALISLGQHGVAEGTVPDWPERWPRCACGAVAEVFGVHLGVVLSPPRRLWEITPRDMPHPQGFPTH